MTAISLAIMPGLDMPGLRATIAGWEWYGDPLILVEAGPRLMQVRVAAQKWAAWNVEGERAMLVSALARVGGG